MPVFKTGAINHSASSPPLYDKREKSRLITGASLQKVMLARVNRSSSLSKTRKHSKISFRFEDNEGVLNARSFAHLIQRRIESQLTPRFAATSFTEYHFSLESMTCLQS
jgi:hypothetical protein